MKILGLNIGHNATAALLDDGRVVAAMQEERLSRVKNAGGIPLLAIQEVLRLAELADLNQIDHVAVSGTWSSYMARDGQHVLQDYARMHEQAGSFLGRPREILADTHWLRGIWKACSEQSHQHRVRGLLADCGILPGRIQFVDHHTCHAMTAYHGFARPEETALVLTNDGEGDGLCATVSIGQDGRLDRISEVSNHHTVAGIYGMITYLLNMTPLEHEHKVMGLAPYGNRHAGMSDLARSFQAMVRWDSADPLRWRRAAGIPLGNRILPSLERLVGRHRFDHIADAVQTFAEEFLVEWVTRCIRETGIGTVCLGGGLFMNVKANQRLLALPGVKRLCVVPSSGDESNAVGAAYAVHTEQQRLKGRLPAIPALSSLYWGGDFSPAEIETAVRDAGTDSRVAVRETATPDRTIAGLVAGGAIVARFAGRMEFGARALGNRSLLANASDADAPRVLNAAIKSRDSWLPFAPSVLRERSSAYLHKPKPMDAPYMAITFDSAPDRRDHCRAAMHPCDFTLRPQEVDAESNPAYYGLLREYEQLTGDGLLLNTSFNLHGEPMVYTPHDAVRVFHRSGLQHLMLGNWYLKKR